MPWTRGRSGDQGLDTLDDTILGDGIDDQTGPAVDRLVVGAVVSGHRSGDAVQEVPAMT